MIVPLPVAARSGFSAIAAGPLAATAGAKPPPAGLVEKRTSRSGAAVIGDVGPRDRGVAGCVHRQRGMLARRAGRGGRARLPGRREDVVRGPRVGLHQVAAVGVDERRPGHDRGPVRRHGHVRGRGPVRRVEVAGGIRDRLRVREQAARALAYRRLEHRAAERALLEDDHRGSVRADADRGRGGVRRGEERLRLLERGRARGQARDPDADAGRQRLVPRHGRVPDASIPTCGAVALLPGSDSLTGAPKEPPGARRAASTTRLPPSLRLHVATVVPSAATATAMCGSCRSSAVSVNGGSQLGAAWAGAAKTASRTAARRARLSTSPAWSLPAAGSGRGRRAACRASAATSRPCRCSRARSRGAARSGGRGSGGSASSRPSRR